MPQHPPRPGKAQRDHAAAVVERLRARFPESRCALAYETPFQLLVATVLSAQTSDLQVNRVTPGLFAAYPDAQAMAAADRDAIAERIRGIGLWRNKAKFLKGLSEMLVEDFGGELPATIEELTRLPGVAKKTATAVLGEAMGIAAGVTVDTHMLRINRRLGLSEAKTADKMAAELERLISPDQWSRYTHRIIDHGRLFCTARAPRCGVCPLADLCPAACDPDEGYKPANDRREPASAAGLSWRQPTAAGRSPASGGDHPGGEDAVID